MIECVSPPLKATTGAAASKADHVRSDCRFMAGGGVHPLATSSVISGGAGRLLRARVSLSHVDHCPVSRCRLELAIIGRIGNNT